MICDQIARSFSSFSFNLNLHTLFKVYFIKEKIVSSNINYCPKWEEKALHLCRDSDVW